MRLVRIVLVAVATALLLSCCASVEMMTPVGPNMKKKWVRKLSAMTERETGCPRKDHSYRYDGDDIHVIIGCDKSSEYLLVSRPMSGFAKVDELRKRAAFEFRCNEADLEISKIEGKTWGVVGCGQQAVYVVVWQLGSAYGWILNSDSRPTTESPRME
jgi:hypothetical protein